MLSFLAADSAENTSYFLYVACVEIITSYAIAISFLLIRKVAVHLIHKFVLNF
jgi:hypothetical protein